MEKALSMIPFNRPVLSGNELKYLQQAIDGGRLAGDGEFTERCEQLLQELTSGGSVHLTHSCTAALEMAAILLNLGPGDEVIMPSFTFVSTANAVVLRGATPVFVDVEPSTFNIDPDQVRQAITSSTKAVWVVHYAGVVVDVDAIQRAAPGIPVVEDAAQALQSERDGRPAGSLGTMAAFSFHETKNITCGEGGALVVNDPALVARAEIVREKGTNRHQFFRGMVDKYTWVDIGSSYLLSELGAAFLFAQLQAVNQILAERLACWNEYHAALAPWRGENVVLPRVPDAVRHNAHLYYLLLPDRQRRQAFIDSMRESGIVTPFHYVPLHSSPAGRRYGRTAGQLSVTDDISDRLVRLPLFPGLLPDIGRVIEAADSALGQSLQTS